MCMLPLKVYVFSEQGNQTLMKMDGPNDPASTTDSRLVAEILQSHKLLPPIPNDYPNFYQVSLKENNAHKQHPHYQKMNYGCILSFVEKLLISFYW